MTRHLTHTDHQRLTHHGILPLTTPDALTLFDHALTLNTPHTLPIHLNPHPTQNTPPLLQTLTNTTLAGATTTTNPSPEQPPFSIDGLTEGEREYAIRDLVLRNAATVLGHPTPDALNPDQGFLAAGFDSLRAIELRNRLNTATTLRLPATLIFDHPTPTTLANHINTLLPASTTVAAAATAAADPQPAPSEYDEFADTSLEDLLDIVDSELRNS